MFHNLSPFLQVTKFLNRMQLHAKQSTSSNKQIVVSVPPSRSDVLHPCDVMEVLTVTSLIIGKCILDVLYVHFTDKAFFFWLFFYRMLQLLMDSMLLKIKQ